MFNQKKHERGQALILIAFAAIGLFAFAALAIDGSRQFSNKRNAQNAADTAALTAALKYVRTAGDMTQAKQAAWERAKSNGYDYQDATNNTKVWVQLCSDQEVHPWTGTPLFEPDGVTKTQVECPGLPAGLTNAQRAEYIRVKIVTNIPTTFGRVIGRDMMMSAAQAVVHVSGSSSSSSSTGTAGAAMVSTRGGNNNQCLLFNGGANLYTHNSGIYINCSGSQAWYMNGNATLNMDAPGSTAGCYYENGSVNWNEVEDPIYCAANGGTSLNINADTYASVPTTLPVPSCGPAASPPVESPANSDIWRYSPGTYSNLTIGSGDTAIFNPGVYCFTGNLNVNGNASVTAPDGRVQLVLQDQNINLNGGQIFDFNDLEVYSRNASFQLNGGAIFRADRLRFFSTGSGTFTVNGNSELTSDDAYLYLYRGDLVWNGGSILNLHAPRHPTPPDVEPFAGLLVYKPWGNTDQLTLNGGSNIHLTGTFLVPSSEVVFNGGVDFVLRSQIIAYTYIVNGNADVDIWYYPEDNFFSAPPPNYNLSINE